MDKDTGLNLKETRVQEEIISGVYINIKEETL